ASNVGMIYLAAWRNDALLVIIMRSKDVIRLEDDISTITKLPNEYAWSTQDIYASTIRSVRVKNASLRASAATGLMRFHCKLAQMIPSPWLPSRHLLNKIIFLEDNSNQI
ncbi:hypothetical protein Tco_0749134, partial [Tanacetum coccineum]